MGTIYPLAVYDNLMPGLRKKLDISRLLIENVRAIITEEKRRTVMIERIRGIRKKAYEFRTFQIIVTITHILILRMHLTLICSGLFATLESHSALWDNYDNERPISCLHPPFA